MYNEKVTNDKKVNRNASPVVFGWDFQINAAIVLMIENIEELDNLRLESKNEDIDIELKNGKHILAQAKSVQNSSSDFRNVRSNLKKALISLSEGSRKVKIEKLIFITNSPNPFNENESRSMFWGHAHRDFDTLLESSKQIIKDYLKDISYPLDTRDFLIQVLPFETDNDIEKYKVVYSVISNFIDKLNIKQYISDQRMHDIWFTDIFRNGSKKDKNIKLHKKDIIWPIIVIITDIERIAQDYFMEDFEQEEYDEIAHDYRELINFCCEKIDFFTKILFDFQNYDYQGTIKEKRIKFVETYYKEYISEFQDKNIDKNKSEKLAKVILYNVIKRRQDIDNIKRKVNL